MDGGFALRDCAPALDVATATPFESFFREHHDFVWRNLRRLGVGTAYVDDALQDVFVTAHRRMHQLRADASERAWLYTILRRVAFRYRRTEQRRRRKIEALEAVAPGEHLDRAAERMDARRFMHRFLDDLGDKRGPVFAMVELEGMSAPEVADALGLKLNTVYSRLRLGRVAFEREVERVRARGREELLAEARRVDDPPVGAAAAAWLLIDPRVLGDLGRVGGGSVLLAQVKVFVLTVAVGTGLMVGARAITGHDARNGEPTWPAALVDAPAPARGATTSAAMPAAGPRSPHRDARPAVSSPAPAPERAAQAGRRRPPASVSLSPAGIDAEAALLKQAKAALTRGDHATARRVLDRHAHDHPDSVLADLRDAMGVEAMCAAGERAQALAAAAAFARRHPDSRLRERVSAICPGDGD